MLFFSQAFPAVKIDKPHCLSSNCLAIIPRYSKPKYPKLMIKDIDSPVQLVDRFMFLSKSNTSKSLNNDYNVKCY